MRAADVAEYILQRLGSMPTMKLQKLVYYCQAWSLAWFGRPLFNERIEAWKKGPVVRSLWELHRGEFIATSIPGHPDRLDGASRRTIDAVLSFYGKKSADELSDLTHVERPWRDARRGCSADDRSACEIDQDGMRSYYSKLGAAAGTVQPTV